MDKKKWFIGIVVVLLVMITSVFGGLSFYNQILNPDPIEIQNYYKKAFVQPNTVSNRCYEGEKYYFSLQNREERVVLWMNTKTMSGEIKYYKSKVLKQSDKITMENGEMFIHSPDLTEIKPLHKGLPYQLFTFEDFKIIQKEKDITDHHGEFLEGNISLTDTQRNAEQKLLSQLKDLYHLNIDFEEGIIENQNFKSEYVYDSNSYEVIKFTMNQSSILMTEGCEK